MKSSIYLEIRTKNNYHIYTLKHSKWQTQIILKALFVGNTDPIAVFGSGRSFRRNHLIRLAESKQNDLLLLFLRTTDFYCYVYQIKFTVLQIFSSTAVFCLCYRATLLLYVFTPLWSVHTALLFRYKDRLVTSQLKCNFFCPCFIFAWCLNFVFILILSWESWNFRTGENHSSTYRNEWRKSRQGCL